MKAWMQKSNLREPRFGRREAKTIGNDWRMFFALALWLFAFPAIAAAQGWYWGSPVTPGYDRATVVEVSGVVLHVDLSTRGGGGSSLRMETGSETVTVTMGPNWYFRSQGADIKIGDKLEVKGSKMKTREGKIYLAAATIKNMRTGHLLELRDENGRPRWSSGRRFDKEGTQEGKP
ncbi:MAG: OB-fold nucleic acid binding domain-containing protein [Deltaproteobacteria bacterium]|nr:OB-fold nucleic acid binding domain-containing protein [Deltaproteobacteria bacterium]